MPSSPLILDRIQVLVETDILIVGTAAVLSMETGVVHVPTLQQRLREQGALLETPSTKACTGAADWGAQSSR